MFVQHGWMGKVRVGYPSDVTDEEWWFVLPYLLLCREDAGQREHDLRAVFNGVRYVARTGCQWRWIPNDLAPWHTVYQQFRRWLSAGVFEALVGDVQSIVREWAGRKGQPTAICIDSRTLQSTPESGARAGYDGAKRRKGSKVHIAVDTLGHLLALTVTPADQGRPRTGRRPGRTGPACNRLHGRNCLCRSRLHRTQRRGRSNSDTTLAETALT